MGNDQRAARLGQVGSTPGLVSMMLVRPSWKSEAICSSGRLSAGTTYSWFSPIRRLLAAGSWYSTAAACWLTSASVHKRAEAAMRRGF